MTRTSIERLADCAPFASPESWPTRKPPRVARDSADIASFARLVRLFLNDAPAVLAAHTAIERWPR